MVEAKRWGGRRLEDVRCFIGGLYGPDLHAERVDALAGATLGVMTGASLAVAVIGQALAQARGLVTKHAIKQSLPPPQALGDSHMCQLARLFSMLEVHCAASFIPRPKCYVTRLTRLFILTSRTIPLSTLHVSMP
jgi:hypothetical protein